MQLFFNIMHCSRVSAGFDGFFYQFEGSVKDV